MLEHVSFMKENINIVIMFKFFDSCLLTISELYQNNMKPVNLEFMDKSCVRFSESYIKKEIFPKNIDGIEIRAYLLLSYYIDAIDKMDILEPFLENVSNIALDKGALDIIVADTPSLMKDTWMIKTSISTAIEENIRQLKNIEVILPYEKISEFLYHVQYRLHQYSFNMCCYGPINQGKIYILADSTRMDIKDYDKQIHQFIKELKRWTRLYNGQLQLGFDFGI